MVYIGTAAFDIVEPNKKSNIKNPNVSGLLRVIVASSLGTIFEWYDFFLYGSLASNIAKHFFAHLPSGTAFVMALFTFSVGFAFRPLGALIFGSFGDKIGRKFTFLATVSIMGAATFLVGVLPTYSTIGISAPIILLVLRILQGLAVGGEYGGAAIYVGEHAPRNKRGLFTGFVQCASPGGLLLSLVVIVCTRKIVGTPIFDAWGWRIPFILSFILLIISVFIRLKLNESPIFVQMKAERRTSKSPLKESFGHRNNCELVLLVLFGLVAGQACIGYTSHFYALFFMTETLKIDSNTTNIMLALVLIITIIADIFFGWLSDKVGRKILVMSGCFLATVSMYPIYMGLTYYGNPKLNDAMHNFPAIVYADSSECSFQFVPTELKEHIKFTSSCDLVKNLLTEYSVPYGIEKLDTETKGIARVKLGNTLLDSGDFETKQNFTASIKHAILSAGYPEKADYDQINLPMIFLLLVAITIFASMGYGPLASWLVQIFPARIRYTSLSLPYHIGNGVIGGFSPTIGFSLILLTGNIYAGLWYPLFFAVLTVILGTLFLKDNGKVDLTQ